MDLEWEISLNKLEMLEFVIGMRPFMFLKVQPFPIYGTTCFYISPLFNKILFQEIFGLS